MKAHIILAVAMALLSGAALAEENRVKFPENLDQLEHYTTVRRGEVTEHLVTSKEALAAAKAGQPLPNGTSVVLIDYRGGKVHRYFVMQKGDGWGNDYSDVRRRTDDWQFQWFWADKSINMQENTARCQGCHKSRSGDQFLYSLDEMKEFNGTVID